MLWQRKSSPKTADGNKMRLERRCPRSWGKASQFSRYVLRLRRPQGQVQRSGSSGWLNRRPDAAPGSEPEGHELLSAVRQAGAARRRTSPQVQTTGPADLGPDHRTGRKILRFALSINNLSCFLNKYVSATVTSAAPVLQPEPGVSQCDCRRS